MRIFLNHSLAVLNHLNSTQRMIPYSFNRTKLQCSLSKKTKILKAFINLIFLFYEYRVIPKYKQNVRRNILQIHILNITLFEKNGVYIYIEYKHNKTSWWWWSSTARYVSIIVCNTCNNEGIIENLGLKIPNSIYMYKNQLYNIRMFPSLVNLEDNIMYRNV